MQKCSVFQHWDPFLKMYIFEAVTFFLTYYLCNQINFFSGSVKTHGFDEAFFLLPQKDPLFLPNCSLKSANCSSLPPSQGIPPVRVFLSTLSYHHFCVPNSICKKPTAFSHAEDLKNSAGGLQCTVNPPVGPGESPGGEPRCEA